MTRPFWYSSLIFNELSFQAETSSADFCTFVGTHSIVVALNLFYSQHPFLHGACHYSGWSNYRYM